MSPRSPHVPACLQGTLLCKVPALRPPSVWTFHGRTRQISYPHLSHRPNLCQSAATSTSTVSIASSKNGFHPDKQLIQIKRLCDIVINSIKNPGISTPVDTPGSYTFFMNTMKGTVLSSPSSDCQIPGQVFPAQVYIHHP